MYGLSAVAVSPPYLCDVQRPIHSTHTLLPLYATFITASTSPTTSHHYLRSLLLSLTKAIITDDITVKLPSNVSRWRTKHAQAWLVHTMELPQYLEAFKGASIDGMLLVNYVSESHLEEMIGTYSTVQYSTVVYGSVYGMAAVPVVLGSRLPLSHPLYVLAPHSSFLLYLMPAHYIRCLSIHFDAVYPLDASTLFLI